MSTDQPAPPRSGTPRAWTGPLFVLAAVACAVPWPLPSMPAIALTLGAAFALLGWSAFASHSKTLSRWLIQAAIVALGLRIELSRLADAAVAGMALAIATIFVGVTLALLLARTLRVSRELGLLIGAGTSICGGSAIAAVAGAIRARSTDVAVATGVVFILNALAVWTFPALGAALGMTPQEFGAWCGAAVHDMASVGATAQGYVPPAAFTGDLASARAQAMDAATLVKLSRVVWIAPLALGAAWLAARWAKDATTPGASPAAAKGKVDVPWFILLFVVAVLLRTLFPALAHAQQTIATLAGCAFALALFLIGSLIAPAALRQAGGRSLILAVVLWIVLAAGSAVALLTLGAPGEL